MPRKIKDILIVIGLVVAFNALFYYTLGPCFVKAWWLTLIGHLPDASCLP